MKPKILCVIPSRLNSTRLPRKPLLKIGSSTLIERVYLQAKKCPFLDKIIVATDSLEIKNALIHTDAIVELTPENIRTGTDRVALISKNHPEFEVVVNLQGDEPFVTPKMLELLVLPYLNNKNPPMSTLAAPLKNNDDLNNPNIVKIILKKNKDALYFSRSPIPYFRNLIEDIVVYSHIGLYAFQRDFLVEYSQMNQTPLEIVESLEQLRALENGYSIHVEITNEKILDINTQEDYEEALRLIQI